MISISSSTASFATHANAGNSSAKTGAATSAAGKKDNSASTTKTPVSRRDEVKLRELAREYSVSGDDIVDVMERLSKSEQADFVKAADGAGNQLRNLIRTTRVLGGNGHLPEERTKYLATAARLEAPDRRNFIRTIENAPSSREMLISMVDQLKKNEDLSHFLKAAEAADKDAREFIGQAQRFSDDAGMDAKAFSNYLTAAAKTGDAVSNFVDTADKLTTSRVVDLTDLVNEKLDSPALDNFFRGTRGFHGDTIATIIDLSNDFSAKDRENFFSTLAQAGKFRKDFLSRVVELDQDNRRNLSNFLEIAEKADAEIETAMVYFDVMNKEFAANLSTTDMANYLEIVQRHGKRMGAIEETAGKLSGEDRSLFLYGAAQGEDLPGLIAGGESLEGEELTAFLVEMANSGSGTDPFIYVKGLLGEEGYQDFKTAGEMLDENTQDKLIDLVENQESDSRTRFLKLAADSPESAKAMVDLVPTLSRQEQETFLDISSTLDRKKQTQWLTAMGKGRKHASEILSLARTLEPESRTHLAKAVGGAETKDLKEFVELFDYLGRQEQVFFLKAADDVGTHLGSLVEMTHGIMERWTTPDEYEYSDFGDVMPTPIIGCLEGVDMMRGGMVSFFIDTFL
ncbi:MAG: hypothetical protein GY737_12095 [Desulfobacteraceae bacterium]|nr:hypothetical protein [Desulfobacteraceae bacterium]